MADVIFLSEFTEVEHIYICAIESYNMGANHI